MPPKARMDIFDTRTLTAEQLDALREVKVKLPVRQHLRLHAIKTVHGKHICDVVRDALDAYFAKTSS